ncbi:MAG: ZIP family metal transporter [Gammaproteobacteria bacterium]|nr:ZIP family metal transporter [Gammaproteobacteria bacterium]
MSLITFKVVAGIVIFIVSMLAGLLPMHMGHFHEGSRHLTDSITNGIFLGAAIFHMIPDSQAGFAALGMINYPYAILLCLAGFIFLQLIKYLTLYFNKAGDSSKLNGTMILIVLCIHSIIEGATLGINTTVANAFVIFIAIIAHKSCDSFALASTLKRYMILPNYNVLIVAIYALMTPFGIAIASTIIGALENNTGILVESSLNALAAGTFIYIGALDALIQQFKVRRLKQNVEDFSALVLGMGFMGFLAIWI